jgi:hypothetical protein
MKARKARPTAGGFALSGASDLGSFARHDRIVKFNPREGDRLDFSRYDADLDTGGRQKLAYRTSQDFAATSKGQFAFDRPTSSLVFDVDGDSVVDTSLTLSGISLVKNSYFLV